MKNFCHLPFAHFTVDTLGDYRVCCQHWVPSEHTQNINFVDHVEWQSNPYLKEVQQAFLADQRHPGCEWCWNKEDLGQSSQRLRTNKEYEILVTKPAPATEIVNVEIQLGNLCNLSCIMCDEQQSSALLAENRKLGLSRIDQKKLDWSDEAWNNLEKIITSRPKILNFRGGEPLYNKKLFQLLDQIPANEASRMILHFSTNATNWNERWHTMLSKFRMIRMMMSIDAVGPVLEYIRYPAIWSDVETRARQMLTLPNIRPLVHATVMNLNIGHLGPLIDWCEAQKLHINLSAVSWPNCLVLSNLPPQARITTVKSIDEILERSLPDHVKQFLLGARQEITTNPFDPELWQRFLNYMRLRESVRHNDHRKILEY